VLAAVLYFPKRSAFVTRELRTDCNQAKGCFAVCAVTAALAHACDGLLGQHSRRRCACANFGAESSKCMH
jgi:hypothetical protein